MVVAATTPVASRTGGASEAMGQRNVAGRRKGKVIEPLLES